MILAFLRCPPISAMLSTRSSGRLVIRRTSCPARGGVCSLPSMPRRAASPLGIALAGCRPTCFGRRRRWAGSTSSSSISAAVTKPGLQWVSQPERLAALMERIDCRTGYHPDRQDHCPYQAGTQNLKVQALVFVGDAMEEKLDDLCHAAGELGVPAFMFQEGDDPIAEQAFREITRLTLAPTVALIRRRSPARRAIARCRRLRSRWGEGARGGTT